MKESSWFKRIWEKNTGDKFPPGVMLLHTLEDGRNKRNTIYSMAWPSDDNLLTLRAGVVQLWNPTTGALLHTLEGAVGYDNVAWSPDGKLLAQVLGEKVGPGWVDPRRRSEGRSEVRLLDPSTGKLLRTFESSKQIKISNTAWSPDGKLLVTNFGDLWDLTTGVLLRSLENQGSRVYFIAWLPDGSRLLTSSKGTVQIWDPATGVLLHTLKDYVGSQPYTDFERVVWSPDSKLLATPATDGRGVRLWDLVTGTLLRTFRGSTFADSIAWSPDGKLLATNSGDDGAVQVWNPATSTLLHVLKRRVDKRRVGYPSIINWSPTGGLLAIVYPYHDKGPSHDRQFLNDVQILHTDTWESLAVFRGLKGTKPIAWHPRLPLLVTPGVQEESLCVWHLDLVRLLGSDLSSELVHSANTRAPSVGDSDVGKQVASLHEHENVTAVPQHKVVVQNFDVFLCHNAQDKPAVKQIGEQLKLHGVLPWLDEWELRPGLPWQQVLEEQIAQIKTVAVFVGKNGLGPWQRQELNAFLREFVRRGCPVIPVLLSDAPQEPSLPEFLKAMTWVDFRIQDPDPMQQLLWGITGRRGGAKGIQGDGRERNP